MFGIALRATFAMGDNYFVSVLEARSVLRDKILDTFKDRNLARDPC